LIKIKICFQKGYIVAGIFKLLTGTILIFLSCGLGCVGLSAMSEKASAQIAGAVCGIVIVVLIILCSITNGIWVLVDWIIILTGGFKDGNGVSLKDW